ncbi:MAG: nucleotidyltransferase domain-containing protein [Chloroflexi bacterium]|nr:nucleotidyltransferase domain-containing protein [Chloroflexota bacterium]
MVTVIAIPRAALAAFCRRERIHRLALFGSVLREDFRPDSDIDVLVEFEPARRIGFIELAGEAHAFAAGKTRADLDGDRLLQAWPDPTCRDHWRGGGSGVGSDTSRPAGHSLVADRREAQPAGSRLFRRESGYLVGYDDS